MLADTLLPRFSPILTVADLDAVLSTSPPWKSSPNARPDGSETGATNAERGLVDCMVLGVDNDLETEDIDALRARGWNYYPRPSRRRNKEVILNVYHHPCNGAEVITWPGGAVVQFCPARVQFGRNDLVADVTQQQLTTMAYAFTERLLPATTRMAWKGAPWLLMKQDGSFERQRDRQFLIWTLRRIDLCLQARVPSAHSFLTAFRLARRPPSSTPPLLWRNYDVTRGKIRGDETGLTFGVPPKKAEDKLPSKIRAKLGSPAWKDNFWELIDEEVLKGQGRVSLTMYDKGAYQETPPGSRVTVGKKLERGRFLRFEARYHGVDGCASLMKLLSPVNAVDHPDTPIEIRVPKSKTKAQMSSPNAIWFDLDYRLLHKAVQAEVLYLQRSGLRKTTSKGKERYRAYPDGWFEALNEERRKLLKAMVSRDANPLLDEAEATDQQRRMAMELAMTKPEPPATPCSLFWALWPRRGQHLRVDDYQAASSRKRSGKGNAVKMRLELKAELELAKGRRF